MFLSKILQFCTLQKLLTQIVSQIANCRCVRFKNWLIHLFIRHFNIKISEALFEDIQHYSTFNDFFIRQLKPNLRPIDDDPNAVTSPADGFISQVGQIYEEQLLQAKGHYYSLRELLGGNLNHTKTFLDGHFMTIYLAPSCYHRLHMPFTGTLREMIYVPGKLFSVNSRAVDSIPNLFARNERVICFFDTAMGPMAIIMVGAMLVAGIHTSWHGDVNVPHQQKMVEWHYPDDVSAPILEKGEELGYFKYGSTVIVIFPKERVKWQPGFSPDMAVKVGERIGLIPKKI